MPQAVKIDYSQLASSAERRKSAALLGFSVQMVKHPQPWKKALSRLLVWRFAVVIDHYSDYWGVNNHPQRTHHAQVVLQVPPDLNTLPIIPSVAHRKTGQSTGAACRSRYR